MSREQIAPQPHFSDAYRDRLLLGYAPEIVHQLQYGWRAATLPDQPAEQLQYVRLQQAATGRPVLYVPGFTEGIVAKAPFAAELASHGHDVILPDQNRTQILRSTVSGKKDATYSQAANYLSVLRQEELLSCPVDVVTHSYGSLIFAAMARLAADRGEAGWLQNGRAVFLAPAGMRENERKLSLAGRFGRMVWSERDGSANDFPDVGGEQFKAGIANATANLPRLVREGFELAKRRVDFDALRSAGVTDMTVLSYAEDRLYTDAVLWPGMQRFVDGGGSWAVPISTERRGDTIRGGQGATHNDEQFNPTRVGRAVSQVLTTSPGAD